MFETEGIYVMMGCETFLDKLYKTLPDLASTKDLVKFGIYRNSQSAYRARGLGPMKCPPWFRMDGRGIVYPKEGVIEFIKDKMKKA